MNPLETVKDRLTQKVGPLPVWGYGLIGAGAIWFLTRNRGGSGSAADQYIPLPDSRTPDQVDDTLGVSGYGYSGPVYGTGSGGSDNPSNAPAIFSDFASEASDPSGGRSVATAPVDTKKPGTTFFEGIGNLFKTGSYYTAIDPGIDVKYPGTDTKLKDGQIRILPFEFTIPNPAAQPKYDPASGGMTIPGTNKTQGITANDLVAISQQKIAADPEIQKRIAEANVTEDQRKFVVLGPGGVLMFANPSGADAALFGETSGPTNTNSKDSVPDTYNGVPLTPGVADYFSQMGIAA